MNRWVGALLVGTVMGAMYQPSSPPRDAKSLISRLKIIASFECDSEKCEEKSFAAINKCTSELQGKISKEEADEAAICYLKGPGKKSAMKACEDSQECKKLIHYHFQDCIESVYDSKKFWNTKQNKMLGGEVAECILKSGGYTKINRFN